MANAVITIDDPRSAPPYAEGPISRWSKRMLNDPRDEVFVRLTLRSLVLQPAAMALLYAALHFTSVPHWIPELAYLSFWGWSVAPIILMLHCTMHRKFIVRSKLLDQAHLPAMAFLFGLPMGYREHHIGMHHMEDNMGRDLSSTLRYRRDSFLHFLVYFSRFFFLITFELTRYLTRNRRPDMARRAWMGEIIQWTIVATSIALGGWHFGVTAFLIPVVLVRFMMMTGNWGQHAFINTAQVNNGLSNAITCINSGYNKRCFNDGYHIGHHLKTKRHWTDAPQDFLDNLDRYAQHDSIVFEGLDFFIVSLLLWTGRWNTLAKHVVRLNGPRSDAEVIAMLKSRVQPVRQWPAEQARRQPLRQSGVSATSVQAADPDAAFGTG